MSLQQIQILQASECAGKLIQCVEVNVLDTVGEQFAAHVCCQVNTELTEFLFRRILQRFDLGAEFGRDVGLAQLSHASEAAVAEHGQHARDDGLVDSGFTALLDEVEEHGVVVEELSDDVVGTSVALLFEVGEFALHFFFGDLAFVVVGLELVGVAFGVASAADREVVAVVAADVLDEVAGAGETAFSGLPFGLASRGITAESDDVADAVVEAEDKTLIDELLITASACQVHRNNESHALCHGANFCCLFVSGTTSAPSDVDEDGRLLGELNENVLEFLIASFSFGRKEFKTNVASSLALFISLDQINNFDLRLNGVICHLFIFLRRILFFNLTKKTTTLCIFWFVD
jgi:hypothetical protein